MKEDKENILYWYPAVANPVATKTSAVCRITVSLIPQPKWFQLFHPSLTENTHTSLLQIDSFYFLPICGVLPRPLFNSSENRVNSNTDKNVRILMLSQSHNIKKKNEWIQKKKQK